MYYEAATTQGRADMAQARAGQISLPHITHIALGTGGHAPDDSSTPITPTPEDVALENEVVRKPVTISFPIATTVRYSCELGKLESNGTTITEAGLFDESGKLIARQTFPGRVKESDIIMKFDWDEAF